MSLMREMAAAGPARPQQELPCVWLLQAAGRACRYFSLQPWPKMEPPGWTEQHGQNSGRKVNS